MIKSNKIIKFSIVIPTRNRSLKLKKALAGIKKVSYAKSKFEVIVVDNGSSDSTKVTVSDFKLKQRDIKCFYSYEPKIGPSYARNNGIKNAKYKYIVCLDDDIIIRKNLLNQYSSILRKYPDVGMIGGNIIAVSKSEKKLNFFLNILGEDSWVFSQSARKETHPTFLSYPDDLISANILINRDIVRGKVFNEKFGRPYGNYMIYAEDIELCFRLLLQEIKILYDPSIKSYHVINKNKLSYKHVFRSFFRAGVEHRLLDVRFHLYGNKVYVFNSRFLIKLLINTIEKPNSSNFIKIIRELFFFVGYYLPVIRN